MIRINLTAAPGIQATERQDSLIVLPMPVQESIPETDFLPGSGEAQVTPETSQVSEETKKRLAAELFDLAERNLDLIEQAEEEEFIPKRTSHVEVRKDAPIEMPARIKRRRPLLRWISMATFILLVLITFLLYPGNLSFKWPEIHYSGAGSLVNTSAFGSND